MNPELKDLYAYPESLHEIDIYIEDLATQCQLLENRIRDMLEMLPSDFGDTILSYLDLRNELEVRAINKAIRFGKKQTQK